MSAAAVNRFFIRELKRDSSENDKTLIWDLWAQIFSNWPLDRTNEATLFSHPGLESRCALSDHGFVIFQRSVDDRGKIAVIGVLPVYRRQGLGRALMQWALSELKDEAHGKGRELKGIDIGSYFPRFWYYVPADIEAGVKLFFESQGFERDASPNAKKPRDLFKNIATEIIPPEIVEIVSKSGLRFAHLSKDLVEECLTKQQANFNWWAAYRNMAQWEQWDEVLIAIDPDTNAQLGWTLLCPSRSVMGAAWAFSYAMPTREKTGLISAVGVDPSARGKGVGLALVAEAMIRLRQRGIEGVYIDGTSIRGFYEKLGLEKVVEFEVWSLKQ